MLLLSTHVYGQSFCGTLASPQQPLDTRYLPQNDRSLTNENLCLRVFYHIIRRSDGTGGVSAYDAMNSFNALNSDFNPNNIYFLWDGTIDYIDNTQKYNDISENIFSVNSHNYGIDIYLYSDDISYYKNLIYFGLATGVGTGSALFVGGHYNDYAGINVLAANSSIISHEMGHVLNLYHTHHGTSIERGGDPNQCAEFVDGSNSDTCGDYIEDTPADPDMDHNVNAFTCTWNDFGTMTDAHGDFYNPNTSLIMSYTKPDCMQYFTPKQVQRMKTAIHGLSVLRNASVSISGSSNLYGTNIYSVSNLPSGYSVSWSFTPNGLAPADFSFQTNTPQTGQCTTSYTNRTQDFSGTLYAAIYKGTTLVTTLSRVLSHVFYPAYIGTYSQTDEFNANHFWDIPTTEFYDEDNIFCNIKSTITLNSPLFAYYNTTYSGVNLTSWNNQGNGTITLKFRYSATDQQHLTVTGRDYNTNNLIYQFYLTALPANGVIILEHLNVSANGETLNIVLDNLDDNDRSPQQISDGIADNNENLLLTITHSITGRNMYRGYIRGVKTEVSTSTWPKGVYIVRAEIGENSVVRKISIQ